MQAYGRKIARLGSVPPSWGFWFSWKILFCISIKCHGQSVVRGHSIAYDVLGAAYFLSSEDPKWSEKLKRAWVSSIKKVCSSRGSVLCRRELQWSSKKCQDRASGLQAQLKASMHSLQGLKTFWRVLWMVFYTVWEFFLFISFSETFASILTEGFPLGCH